MSISELNHFMTYVIEGWMLFSAGFISTTFVAFVSKRIQEDLEAAELQAAEEAETARLEEVAAVSEKLAQEKNKQSGTSSVSVST